MIKRLEKTYGVTIEDDSFISPISGRTVKQYAIFTADGCRWECGLSYQNLLKEFKEYGNIFLNIKNRCMA